MNSLGVLAFGTRESARRILTGWSPLLLVAAVVGHPAPLLPGTRPERGPLFGQFSFALVFFFFSASSPQAGCVTPAGRKFRGVPLSLKLKLSGLDDLYVESSLAASEARVASKRRVTRILSDTYL